MLVYHNRANTKALQGRYDKSLNDFVRAIRIDGTNWESYNGRGCVLFAIGELEKAEADFTKAIEQLEKERVDFIETIKLYPQNRLLSTLRPHHLHDLALSGLYSRRGRVRDQMIDSIPHSKGAADDMTKAISLVMYYGYYLREV